MNLKLFTFLLTAVLLIPLLLLGCTLQNTSELEERVTELEEKLAEKKAKEAEEEKAGIEKLEEEEPVDLEVVEEEDDMVTEEGTAEDEEAEDESAEDSITGQVEEEIESEPEEVQEPNEEQEVVEAESVEEDTDEERMDELVEKEPEENEVFRVQIPASPSMSGLIAAGGTIRHGTSPILIGDTTAGTQMKGYLSFDIRSLHGTTVGAANMIFSIERLNYPESISHSLIIKVYDYGEYLDISDFAVGGSFVTSQAINVSMDGFMIMNNEILKDELQKVLDDRSRDYFQLKLGLNNVTNGDDVIDAISIPNCGEEVWLLVTYWE